jgi:large subunit ribosomal protein L18
MVKKHTHHTVPFRRKRKGKTNYRKRFSVLKSGKPRIFLKIGSKDAVAQVIDYKEDGDEVVISSRASELKDKGWFFTNPNIPTCYLFGYYFGKLCEKNKIKSVIFDTGVVKPKHGGRYFAFAKGIVDSGIEIPVEEAAFPSEERIKGEHIAKYTAALKEKGELSKKYSVFINKAHNPEKISELFDKTLKKLDSL